MASATTAAVLPPRGLLHSSCWLAQPSSPHLSKPGAYSLRSTSTASRAVSSQTWRFDEPGNRRSICCGIQLWHRTRRVVVTGVRGGGVIVGGAAVGGRAGGGRGAGGVGLRAVVGEVGVGVRAAGVGSCKLQRRLAQDTLSVCRLLKSSERGSSSLSLSSSSPSSSSSSSLSSSLRLDSVPRAVAEDAPQTLASVSETSEDEADANGGTTSQGGEIADGVSSEAGGTEIEPTEASGEVRDGPSSSPTPAIDARRRARGGGRQRRTVSVKIQDLQLGQILQGTVKSIQSYGAFVDIGSSTDGLLHISQLENFFVKEVQDVVAVGQEVAVRIIDVDLDKGRISLSMKDPNQVDQRRDGSQAENSVPRSDEADGAMPQARKIAGRGRKSPTANKDKATHNFKKGQTVKGVVKNILAYGAFVELAEGLEGLLHGSEIREGGENVAIETMLTTGQEVQVRILSVENNRISLSMREKVDVSRINTDMNVGDDEALKPFQLAFRRANLIRDSFPSLNPDADAAPSLADELEVKDAKSTEGEEVDVAPETEAVAELEDAAEPSSTDENAQLEIAGAAEAIAAESQGVDELAAAEELKVEDAVESIAVPMEIPDSPVSETIDDSSPGNVMENADVSAEVEEPEPVADSTPVNVLENADASAEVEEPEPAAAAVLEPVAEAAVDSTMVEVNESTDAVPSVEQSQPAVAEATAEQTDSTDVSSSVALASDLSAQAEETEKPSTSSDVKITAALVKELREETGAGMMDCKRALEETKGDKSKAQDLLRKRGLAKADKKAARIAAEGLIVSYIHDNRIGVLLELNCETDFVARGEKFRELADEIAMQVAACQQVKYVDISEIPESVLHTERSIEMGKDDIQNKPEAIREKIVEGRVTKRLGEVCLMELPYIRNDKLSVKDLVKQAVATIGENIRIRRFVRYERGEGIEKKAVDFAQDVAEQMKAMSGATSQENAPSAAPPAPATEDAESNPEASPAAKPVPLAVIQRLRQETGAGVMDCKKAVAEADGDVEKAREWLRKKGLASAEKKASRTAAEGVIASYVHDSRIGVVAEINCETDFVARGEKFQELVEDICMQIAASADVVAVSVSDIPEEFVTKEREIEMGKEDILSKPEAIRGKIVEGRVAKCLNELALLEQPFIRNDKILVKDYIKEAVALLGENITVKRFEKFVLGEGLEKRVTDFAAEVAAQAGGAA